MCSDLLGAFGGGRAGDVSNGVGENLSMGIVAGESRHVLCIVTGIYCLQ